MRTNLTPGATNNATSMFATTPTQAYRPSTTRRVIGGIAGAAVNVVAVFLVALIHHRESIPRLVRGREAGEPRGGALGGLRSPLRGAGLACDVDAAHRGAARRARAALDHGHHRAADVCHHVLVDLDL